MIMYIMVWVQVGATTYMSTMYVFHQGAVGGSLMALGIMAWVQVGAVLYPFTTHQHLATPTHNCTGMDGLPFNITTTTNHTQ